MKKHESRRINNGDEYSYYKNGEIVKTIVKSSLFYCGWVDSNNFLHHLGGPAWSMGIIKFFYIHGIKYGTITEYEIAWNRLEMLDEL